MTTRIATHAIVAWTLARTRVTERLRDERGEVTSQIILIAIFAALAIAAASSQLRNATTAIRHEAHETASESSASNSARASRGITRALISRSPS